MHVERISSRETGSYNLNDTNHITASTVPVAKLYTALSLWKPEDCVPTPIKEEALYIASIDSWAYDGIREDWKGNPLDIQVYILGSDISTGISFLWEPYVEYLYRKNFLTNYYKPDKLHRLSYVEGQCSHLGIFTQQGHMAANSYDGYQMYQSIK